MTYVWADVPRHPGCGGPGVPRAAAAWNHRAKPGDTLVCPECGDGWIGTPEDVAKAEAAQAAWDKAMDKEVRTTLRRAREAELARRVKEAVDGKATWKREKVEAVPEE